MATCLAVVAIGIYLPFSPLARRARLHAVAGDILRFSRSSRRQPISCWWKPPNGTFSVEQPPRMQSNMATYCRSRGRLSGERCVCRLSEQLQTLD